MGTRSITETAGGNVQDHGAIHSTADFSQYIEDRPEEGIFTVDREIFRNSEIFALEMKYIFEDIWIYLAHESQLPHPHDFLNHSDRPPAGDPDARSGGPDRMLHQRLSASRLDGLSSPARKPQST